MREKDNNQITNLLNNIYKIKILIKRKGVVMKLVGSNIPIVS